MRTAFVAKGLTSSTLRSLNYTPEVEAFRRLSESRESVPLGTLLSRMGESYGKVFVRYDCAPELGEELITQGDMFAAEPDGRIIRGDALPRLEDHRVERLDVLIAGAGTLGETELFGRSIIADDRLVGRIVGPHAMKLGFIEPESDAALYTYAFLNTRVGIRAVRATGFGTKILGLRKDLLRTLPIPLPGGAIQHLSVPQICALNARSGGHTSYGRTGPIPDHRSRDADSFAAQRMIRADRSGDPKHLKGPNSRVIHGPVHSDPSPADGSLSESRPPLRDGRLADEPAVARLKLVPCQSSSAGRVRGRARAAGSPSKILPIRQRQCASPRGARNGQRGGEAPSRVRPGARPPPACPGVYVGRRRTH